MFLLLFGYDGSEEQQPELVTVHSVHSNLCTEIAKQRFRACLSRVYHAETV